MFGYYVITAFLLGLASLLNRNHLVRILLLYFFLAVQTAITIFGYFHPNEEFLGYIKFDALGIIFMCVLTLLTYTTIYHSYIYLQHRKDNSRSQSIYFAALIMLVLAMTCVYLSCHLGVMWVFIELTTLCVALLIYHERTPLSLEATWKYVFVCSIGITLTFIGIIFLNISIEDTEDINFSFNALQQQLLNVNIFWLKLAFLFMIVGFSTKMGLFPMHSAAIDAHTVAPPPISAFISTTLMNVGFIAIFRTYSLFAHTAIQPWTNQVLLWSGLLSIVVSAAYLLKVTHLKRMSAYSSIEHMGIAVIGLASGGIGYFASIFHMVLHSFVKASVFYQIDQFHRHFRTYIISETGNYFNRNLPGAMVMLLVFIGIIAMPPSGLFITEFWIFKSMFSASHIIFLILALLFLSVAIYSLSKNFFFILFNQTKDLPPVYEKIHPSETYSQYFLLALVFYLGMNPPVRMISLIQEAVRNLP
jgi:hydrogenase-4 component F